MMLLRRNVPKIRGHRQWGQRQIFGHFRNLKSRSYISYYYKMWNWNVQLFKIKIQVSKREDVKTCDEFEVTHLLEVTHNIRSS